MEDLNQVFPFPPLTEEEFKELKEDIAERGVQIPIEVDEIGRVIDGYHRLKACRELGIKDIPFICREGLTESEKLTQAIRLNLLRRHLSQEQRRELISELVTVTPERSDRQMASDLGVSPTTVGKVRKQLEDSGDVSRLDTSIDTLGREQPRQRKAPETKPMPKNTAAGKTGEADGGPKEDLSGKDAVTEPRKMSMSDDLQMALRMEIDGLDSVLKGLLDDYQGYEKMEDMLFSPEGISVALEGLTGLKEVVEKYEKLIQARERKLKQG